MFHWDKGLILSASGIAVDFTRRQTLGFVSHAHADHLARHALTLCTPETESLARHRLKSKPMQQFRTLRYHVPLDWEGTRLTVYPAGHCLGSAMLLAEDLESGRSLLYTGDFKLGRSATCPEAVVPRADELVIESTFGTPKYRMPSREETIARLIEEVGNTLADGLTPVVYAYSLGKGQEVTKLLTDAGFPVQQHKSTFEISAIYRRHGVDLGDVVLLEKHTSEPGRVLLVPPQAGRYAGSFTTPTRPRTFVVTGWAIEKGATYKYGVDVALPLSDHADYDELIEAVRRAAPERVFCTHGDTAFVDRLNDLGFHARPLENHCQYQQRFF